MIHYINGNMFDYNVDFRINTVNCVGVMGAGVAKQFKEKYPDMFRDYARRCRIRQLRPGIPYVWRKNGEMFESSSSECIINFPTKNHWRNPSEYSYIESGLKWLKMFLSNYPNGSITIPALGCGHGGLEWLKVKSMINQYLSSLPTTIYVFEPDNSSYCSFDASINEQMVEKGIMCIPPSHTDYPTMLRGKSAVNFFVKGNPAVLQRKMTGLFLSARATDREYNALISCVKQLKGNDTTFVMPLCTKKDYALLKEIVEANCNIVAMLPHSLLKPFESAEIDANIRVVPTYVSVMASDTAKNVAAYSRCRRAVESIANKILVSTADENVLYKQLYSLRNRSNVFYIKYWSELPSVLHGMPAKPIGKKKDGQVNVKPISDCE